jgi:hypothetical protein
MNRKSVARVRLSQKSEDHTREYRTDELDHLVLDSVHVDYHDLRRLYVANLLGCQTQQPREEGRIVLRRARRRVTEKGIVLPKP